MKRIDCAHCGESVVASSRNPKQEYCGKPACQRTRKTKWENQKIKTDPDYRANRRDSQKTWAEKNPDYQKQYKKTPRQVERNRILQKVRYQRQKKKKACLDEGGLSKNVAKMDALKFNKTGISGTFWLVPSVAKMDALMVQITDIKETMRPGVEGFL